MALFSGLMQKSKCANCGKEVPSGKGIRKNGKDFDSGKCLAAWEKKNNSARAKSKEVCEFC